MHIAVTIVHPLLINKSLIILKSLTSNITLDDIYPIIIIGSTISFAGKPNMKAVSIIPSKPINIPIGFKKLDIDSFDTIGEEAFSYCKKLEEISFKNCSIVLNNAFAYDSALKKISLPAVMDINFRGFVNCGIENIEKEDFDTAINLLLERYINA